MRQTHYIEKINIETKGQKTFGGRNQIQSKSKYKHQIHTHIHNQNQKTKTK
jgi:hypothetical protein